MTSFYKNKKVVVTGAAGMVGAHLCTRLRDSGAYVLGLDNLSRGTNKIPGVTYKYVDVSNEGALRDNLSGIDMIFNLAATVAGVMYNQSHHWQMYTENHRLQEIPLKIARYYKTERFLQTSSVCVYSPEHNNPCMEENGTLGEPVDANIGYSLAKRAGERLAIWAAETGLHTVIVRPTNIFGDRDYFDDRAHVIPALIKKCLQDNEIVVNGTGREIREFIYVEDVACGMMAAMEHGDPGSIYNLGTGGDTAVTIHELVNLIQEITETTHKRVIFKHVADPGDSARWTISEKARYELGWESYTPLREGLEKTIGWYIQHKEQTNES